MSDNQLQQGCAQKEVTVHQSDLPLVCPMPSMVIWNAHPRNFLPIEEAGGEVTCPYCGTHYVLASS